MTGGISNGDTTNKKTAAKIIVPILIVLVVAAIWFMKNSANKDAAIPAADSPDFVLETDSIDLAQLRSYGLPIMIDFGADSCIPCKEMAPVLKELNAEYQGKVIVKFVDVWKHPDAAADFPVQVIPTQFFFTADGKPFVPSDPEAMGMNLYTRRDSGEHVYTAHQGGMTKEQILAVFAEMGVD